MDYAVRKILFSFILLLWASVAFGGTTYYANLGGAGTNAGTYANPFTSMATINSFAFATGDDLYFLAGMDAIPSAALSVDWTGTETDRVIIGAYNTGPVLELNGGDRPILDGNSWTVPSTASWSGLIDVPTGSHYVTIKDLHIYQSGGYGIDFSPSLYETLLDPIVSNCYVQESFRGGILFYHTTNGLVENNEVYWASRGKDLGYSFAGASIELIGGDAEFHEALVQNNTIRGNTVHYGNEGIGVYKRAQHTLVEDNTVYDCWTVHIYVARSRDGIIRNNVVYQTASPRSPGKGRGIAFQIEVVSASTGVVKPYAPIENWDVYNNYIGGELFNMGISCGVDYYAPVAPTRFGPNVTIHDNIIVDTVENIKFYNPNSEWDVTFEDNISFILAGAGDHVESGEESAEGVTWTNNFFNSVVIGNAGATALPTDTYYLVTDTGWDSLTPPVTSANFALTGIGADTCESLGYYCCPTDSGTGAQSSYDGTCEVGEYCYEDCTPTIGPALDTSNLYGGSGGTYTPLLVFLGENGSGTTVTDHSGNNDDATLTNPVWTSNGISMAATGSVFSAPAPTIGTTISLVVAFTSTQSIGPEYGKFFHYDYTFQFERAQIDTHYNSEIGNIQAEYTASKDVYDQYFHVAVVTYDDPNNQQCLYLDGSLQECIVSALTFPTLSGTVQFGSKSDGSRQGNIVIHLAALYTGEMSETDALSLYNDYDQMFTNPPSRTFSTPSVASFAGGSEISSAKTLITIDSSKPLTTISQ